MKFIGIDNYKEDALAGFLLGLGFILASSIGVFSLALPPVASLLSTNISIFLVTVLLAPILEETLFRGIILPVLMTLFKSGTSILISAGLYGAAIAFSTFHLFAYTSQDLASVTLTSLFSAGGSFISAFIFSVVMGYVAIKRNNILPGMIAHSMINLWLLVGVSILI